MSDLKIERHKLQPSFPNETWITSGSRGDEFTVTLKQGEDIEIEHDWDHGYGGRGCERMTIPVKLLRELLNELGM
jgi:hypothetical protein